jgi:DNA-binding SARP family transcriptional activator/Flp pilus assembly protein TadD
MADLDVRLFAGFEVVQASGRALKFPTRKSRALLAVLSRHPGKRHGREALAALLWPESAEAQARANLRQALKQLRRALGDLRDAVIIADGDTLALQPGAVEVDVARFEARHAEGTPEALEEAVQLYRGEFLEGFSLREEPFSDWVTIERAHLRELALDALGKLSAHLAHAGETEQAIPLALRLVGLEPLLESAHRLLMRLSAQGRRGAAVEQYRRCRDILRRELGTRPEPETEQLFQKIRSHKPQLVSTGPGIGPTDAAVTERLHEVISDPLLQRPAVAVLPFRNLSGEPEQIYFTDGLSEDIVTALAGWRCFPIIASSSTCNYKHQSANAARIADDLGARYVVDGSVRRSGSRLRISARLIESDSGYTLWTDRFDFHLDDILVVQEEASQKIAAVVEPELERAELRRIVTKRTEDLAAWDLWLQGNAFLHRRTADGNAHARSRFEQALRLDPGYADAFTGLAYGYLQEIWDTSPDAREPVIEKGLEAARRAVDLDRDSSMAHLAVATAFVWAERFDIAIPETERAIELNPSNALARGGLGNRLDLIGRTEEGIVHLEAGLRLDPRSSNSWNFMGFLSRAYLSARRYENALDLAQRAVRLRPDLPMAHYRHAVCLGHLDRAEEACAALRQCERLSPGFLASREGWQPYADPDRNDHFFAGLRRHRLLG